MTRSHYTWAGAIERAIQNLQRASEEAESRRFGKALELIELVLKDLRIAITFIVKELRK